MTSAAPLAEPSLVNNPTPVHCSSAVAGSRFDFGAVQVRDFAASGLHSERASSGAVARM
jgi:hypothetical protein